MNRFQFKSVAKFRVFVPGFLAVAGLCAPRMAAADNIVQGAIPDFYQHQGDSGPQPPLPPGAPFSNSPSVATAILPWRPLAGPQPIWNPDGGWCAFVSDMDALYPWETLSLPVIGKPFDNATTSLFGNVGTPAMPGPPPTPAVPSGGALLSGKGTWVPAADDTVIPALITAGTINNYLTAQKVDPGSLGLLGLVDTQYLVLPQGAVVPVGLVVRGAAGILPVGAVLPAGQVLVATIGGWDTESQNTFQLYQQLTSAGSNLPAAGSLQQLAAITTTIRINYAPTNPPDPNPPAFNSAATTGFWWGFHQVAGAGTAGANTIRYSDPDAIPINAANNTGGITQANVNANEYTVAQQAAAPPLPGNGAYTTANLYSTMTINALGQVTGGNTPYAAGLKGATAPVTQITNLDAVSLPAVQVVNNVAQAGYNVVKFLFTGDFGGDISNLEIFTNSQLANAANNSGLSETDPDWSISPVTQDPFGNDWGPGFAGIDLDEDTGGQDLMEGAAEGDAPDYVAYEDTTSPVTGWTVFAYDDAEDAWLTESYGATVGFDNGPQVPEPGTLSLIALGGFALLRRRARQ